MFLGLMVTLAAIALLLKPQEPAALSNNKLASRREKACFEVNLRGMRHCGFLCAESCLGAR